MIIGKVKPEKSFVIDAANVLLTSYLVAAEGQIFNTKSTSGGQISSTQF